MWCSWESQLPILCPRMGQTAGRRKQQAAPCPCKLHHFFKAYEAIREWKLRYKIRELFPGFSFFLTGASLIIHSAWYTVFSKQFLKFVIWKPLENEVLQVEFWPTYGQTQISRPAEITDTKEVGTPFTSKLKKAPWDVAMMTMGNDELHCGYKLQTNSAIAGNTKKLPDTPTAKCMTTYSK